MYCIHSLYIDPYFNIASEEYFLKEFTDEFFLLYRNEPSVVVGKHQNTLAEINYEYVTNNNIKVVRRLTGGGTVYHDLGNINYTFIRNGKEGKLVDFRKHTQPIIDFLEKLGLETRFEGRNSLMINGLKVSGNAEHVFKERILHHGTLLFSSTLKDLEKAIRVNPLDYTDKAVKSIRSRVFNIADLLNRKISLQEFQNLINEHIKRLFPDATDYQLTKNDYERINVLVKKKYALWEWNFGYSPKYELKKKIEISGKSLDVFLKVEKGIIKEVMLETDLLDKECVSTVSDIMTGIQHRREPLEEELRNKASGCFSNQELEVFVRNLF